MDTSEQYIKMCEKATEIQEGKPQDGVGGSWLQGSIIVDDGFQSERGDFYHIVDTEDERVCESCGHSERYIKCTKSTWLPRQDQLQEMMIPYGLYAFYNFVYRHDWRDGDYLPDCNKVYESMEQLWLAFYMSKKHNKYWDGTSWNLRQ